MAHAKKLKFWYNFTGAALDSNIWTTEGAGSSYAMVDAIDGGFRLTTGTSNSDSANIHFNDIKQFDDSASEFISVIKLTTLTNQITAVGLRDGEDFVRMLFDSNTGSGEFTMQTKDGATAETTDTGITGDTNWHVHSGKMLSASVEGYIDGVLKATHSTNIPDSGQLEPLYFVFNRTAATNSSDIRYFEVYNT